MTENKKKTKTTAIVQFADGQLEIKADKDGLASLTEIWRRAGEPAGKRPNDWLLTNEAIAFVHHIQILITGIPVIKTSKGRYGGTYGQVQIALKYAQWLSPEFQKTVNDVFIERIEEEIDPELGVMRARARLDKRMDALGRDQTAKDKRHRSVDKRKELTSVLAEHGVTAGNKPWLNGFAKVTNAQYVGWKGRNAVQMRGDLGIGPRENPRDHFSNIDLDTITFIDSLTAHKVRTENTWGADEAASIGHQVGKQVGQMFAAVMGPASSSVVVSPPHANPYFAA